MRSLAWADLRAERFPLTPEGVFNALVHDLEARARREQDRCARRQACVADFEVEGDEEEVRKEVGAYMAAVQEDALTTSCGREQDHRCNPDAFMGSSPYKPRFWASAVAQAEQVHIDSMRVLLELHYAEVAWRRAADETSQRRRGQRGEEPSVPTSVRKAAAESQLRPRCQVMRLPASVKQVLVEPAHESDWDRLEQLRRVVVQLACQEEAVDFGNADTLQRFQASLPGTVGDEGATLVSEFTISSEPPVTLPAGARVVLPGRRRSADRYITELLQQGDYQLLLQKRPPSSTTCPPMFNSEAARLLGNHVEMVARNWPEHRLTPAEVLDRLLLALWCVLFWADCARWQEMGVANTSSQQAVELGRWFLWGQSVAT